MCPKALVAHISHYGSKDPKLGPAGTLCIRTRSFDGQSHMWPYMWSSTF